MQVQTATNQAWSCSNEAKMIKNQNHHISTNHWRWQVGTTCGARWWANPPKCRLANLHLVRPHVAHIPIDISIFSKIGGAHMAAIGRPTDLGSGPILSRFTPTDIPMMNMWWKFPTIDHMAVPRSVWSNGGEEGAHGSLTWRWSSPYSISPYKYLLREPS